MREASWLMMMNGCSTGWLPTHVRMERLATRIQNRSWERGRKVIVCWWIGGEEGLEIGLIQRRLGLVLLPVCWGLSVGWHMQIGSIILA